MVLKFCRKWPKVILGASFVILAAAIFLLDFKTYTKDQLEYSVSSYMEYVLAQSVHSLESNMNYLGIRLENQARIFNLHDSMSDAEILTELKIFASDESIARATIITPSGIVYSSEFGITYVDPEQFSKSFVREGFYITKPRVYEKTGQKFIDISVPVKIDGKKFGSLSISYDRSNLQNIFNVSFLDDDCAINLVTGDGTVIGRISNRTAPTDFDDNLFEFYDNNDVTFFQGSLTEIKNSFANNKSGSAKYKNDGTEYSVIYAPVAISDWYIATVTTDFSIKMQTKNLEKKASVLVFRTVFILLFIMIIFIAYYFREHRALAELKDSYMLALKKSNDIFLEIDLKNDTYYDHSEKSDEFFLGIKEKKYSDFVRKYSMFCNSNDRQDFLNHFLPKYLENAIQTDSNKSKFEYKITSPEGVSYYFETDIIPIIEGGHGGHKIFGIGNNITAQKAVTDGLKRAATLDGLTHLCNRTTAQNQIDDFLSNNGQAGMHALFMIDIDHFKEINDRFGHVKGDEIICLIGKILNTVFRSSDILGRIGGDEFIAFLKDYNNIEVVKSKAAQLNRLFNSIKISDSNSENNAFFKTSLSIGIALYSDGGTTFEELYKNADTALYASKAAGKDCFSFFTPQI